MPNNGFDGKNQLVNPGKERLQSRTQGNPGKEQELREIKREDLAPEKPGKPLTGPAGPAVILATDPQGPKVAIVKGQWRPTI